MSYKNVKRPQAKDYKEERRFTDEGPTFNSNKDNKEN